VGRVLFKVEQGTVAITLSDGDHVVTAGETLNASTEDREAIRNVSADVARFIEVDLLDAVATLTEAGPEFVASGSTGVVNAWPIQAGATLPAGSARVVLERLTIPPDAEVPAFTATGLDWLGIEEGRVGVTLEGEHLPFRWDPGEERTFGVDQHPPLFAPGTRVTLHNAGDGQLILYRLTLTPTQTRGSAGTPAP
jgi:hypothetical protein